MEHTSILAMFRIGYINKLNNVYHKKCVNNCQTLINYTIKCT